MEFWHLARLLDQSAQYSELLFVAFAGLLGTFVARCLSRFRGRYASSRLSRIVRRCFLACSLTPTVGVLFGADSDARPEVWLDVPFVRGDKNLCGAAAVSMVLQYWQKVTPDTSLPVPSFSRIFQALQSSETEGVLGSQMKAYLASLGYEVFVFKGEWEDIENHISKGRPLIAALGTRGALDHYVVVTGLNHPEKVVLINDPARRKLLKLNRKDFQKAWQQTSFWTLLTLPPHPSSKPASDAR